MRKNAVSWAALIVASAALIGSRGFNRPLPASLQTPEEGKKTAKALSSAFEGVAEFVKPSVVQISIETDKPKVQIRRRGDNNPGDPFRDLIPDELRQEVRGRVEEIS